MATNLQITVNGKPHRVEAAPDTPLLYVLRDEMNLNGPKFAAAARAAAPRADRYERRQNPIREKFSRCSGVRIGAISRSDWTRSCTDCPIREWTSAAFC